MAERPAAPMPITADFPAPSRIRAQRDFKRCFATGRRAHSRGLTAVYRAHDDSDHQNGLQQVRLGMAFSRKVDGRAVERNRLKRLTREWFRHNHHGLSAGDLVIVGKSAARGSSTSQLSEELDSLVRRLGLLVSAGEGKMPSSPSPSQSGLGS
ncbi:MAG TPA: ribonuclease P protein component [Chiayiivirga sp.]|jgi:ribonuclease P protein component|nr:ribonuclease P protein component [Chiayiivirga sp.]